MSLKLNEQLVSILIKNIIRELANTLNNLFTFKNFRMLENSIITLHIDKSKSDTDIHITLVLSAISL